jgi:hypothetical protein
VHPLDLAPHGVRVELLAGAGLYRRTVSRRIIVDLSALSARAVKALTSPGAARYTRPAPGSRTRVAAPAAGAATSPTTPTSRMRRISTRQATRQPARCCG